MVRSPSGDRSLEYVLAARCPKNTRTPIPFEPDSFSVSTSPSRTVVENSLPSIATASAAVAPPCIAWCTTSTASCFKSADDTCVLVALSCVDTLMSFLSIQKLNAARVDSLNRWLLLLLARLSRCLCVSVVGFAFDFRLARKLPARSAHRQSVHLECRNPHAHRHRLPVFAADADTFVELQVVADHRHPRQHIRPVADQRSVLQRSGNLAVL